jgi:hypothetical protein
MVEEQHVLEALNQACHGQTLSIQSNAMKYLQNLDTLISSTVDSNSSLLNIFLNILYNYSHLIDQDCRLLAVICLKNYISHSWIPRDLNSSLLTIESKNFLKTNILNLLSEENLKISLQLSLLIAKIARYDWVEGQWPTLFHELFQRITTGDWILSTNSTQTLLQILLILNTRKLSQNKQQLLQLSLELLEPLVAHWITLQNTFLTMYSPSSSTSSSTSGSTNVMTYETMKQYETMCSYNAMGNHLCTVTRIIQILFLQSFKSIQSSSPFIHSFLTSIGEFIQRYDELLATVPSLLLNEAMNTSSGSDDSSARSRIKFIFQNIELGSIGSDIWSSIGSWNDGNDPIDAGLPTTSPICYQYGLDSIDITSTILSSHLQRVPKTLCELVIQISLTASRVLMSLVVIPYYLHKECSTLNEMEALISPYLSLYYSLLQGQFTPPTHSISSSIELNPYSRNCACEPLALVYTLFLSNLLTSYSMPDQEEGGEEMAFHQSTTVRQFFSSPEDTCSTKLTSLFQLLTTHLLPLSKYYFDSWVIDSEELFLSLQSSNEGDSLRHASEGLFTSMMTYSTRAVCGEMAVLIQQVDRQESLSIDLMTSLENSQMTLMTTNNDRDFLLFQRELLYWEGIFTCCGLTPYYLSQHCDMSSWLVMVIGPLLTSLHQIGLADYEKRAQSSSSSSLTSPHAVYYLLQSLVYRSMWLLSCWVHTFDPPTLTQIITLLISFIRPVHTSTRGHHGSSTSANPVIVSPSPFDALVKLQVIQTLETITHSPSFQTQMLVPVIEDLFYGSCQMMLKELNDPHSQTLIISLFQNIIQSFGYISSSFLQTLVSYLLPLYFLDEDTATDTVSGGGGGGDEQEEEEGMSNEAEAGGESGIDSYGQEKELSSNLLRSQLLDLFSVVIDALHNPYLSSDPLLLHSLDKDLVTNYHEIHHQLLPVILHSTSSSHHTVQHIIKSGLQLWSKLLRNTIYLPNNPSSHQHKQQLEHIFSQNILRIFQADFFSFEFEEMKIFFSILESTLLLGGLPLLIPSTSPTSREVFSQLFSHLIGELRPRIISYALRPMECLLLLQCYVNQIHGNDATSGVPTDTSTFHYMINGPHALPLPQPSDAPLSSPGGTVDAPSSFCSEFLSSIGVLKMMLRACCSMFTCISTSTSDIQGTSVDTLYLRIHDIYEEYEEADVAIVSYLSLLCRVYLLSPHIFYATCDEIAQELSQQSLIPVSYEFIFKSFFLFLLQKFDGVGYHRGGVWHRNVCCVALLQLYPTQDLQILCLLPDILYVVDDVLSEKMTKEGQKKLKEFHENYLSLDDSHHDADEEEEDQDEGEGEGNASLVKKKKLTINYLWSELLQSDPILEQGGLHQLVTRKFQEISQLVPREELEGRILQEMDRNVLMRILANDYEEIEHEE